MQPVRSIERKERMIVKKEEIEAKE